MPDPLGTEEKDPDISALKRRTLDVSRKSFRIPEVFAVGPPRTATTWLHEVLRGHVNLPERIKETRFFDRRYAKGLKWYAAHFEHAIDGVPCGEIAPTYFYSAEVRRRISRLVPDAKIICSFRDPVERLYSLYRLKFVTGDLTCPFEEAVEQDFEMIESSRYAFHLSAWIRAFGRSNILALTYEELLRDPRSYVDRVCRHIGIPSFELEPSLLTREYSSGEWSVPAHPHWARIAFKAAGWLSASRYSRARAMVKKLGLQSLLIKKTGSGPPPLNPNFAIELRRRMRDEVEALETLLGTGLPLWKETTAWEQ